MDITITVTGFDELIKKVNDPTLLGEPMRGFFQKSAIAIQSDAQTLTPVDTGRLRASITSLVDPSPMPMFGQVGTNMIPHYGPDIEYGTRPHFPPISALMGWAHRHGMNPYAIARKIARYGTKPYQMFHKAVQQNMSNIEGFLKEAASEIESRWGSK